MEAIGCSVRSGAWKRAASTFFAADRQTTFVTESALSRTGDGLEYHREQIKRKLNLQGAAELTQYATSWLQREIPS